MPAHPRTPGTTPIFGWPDRVFSFLARARTAEGVEIAIFAVIWVPFPGPTTLVELYKLFTHI